MSAAFTQGPWHVDETRYHADGGDWRNIYGSGFNPPVLAVVKAPESSISANANLIAAAPELYDAAFEFQQATQERLNAQFSGEGYWLATDDWRKAESRLVAALAKARGGQVPA